MATESIPSLIRQVMGGSISWLRDPGAKRSKVWQGLDRVAILADDNYTASYGDDRTPGFSRWLHHYARTPRPAGVIGRDPQRLQKSQMKRRGNVPPKTRDGGVGGSHLEGRPPARLAEACALLRSAEWSALGAPWQWLAPRLYHPTGTNNGSDSPTGS
jgi:hypothetical protein